MTAKAKTNPKAGGRSPRSRRARLSVAYLPLDRLKPDPGNARRHSAKQIGQIARSIEAFGFNVPILVDGDGNVVAGHGRLEAARRLGWSEIPAIRLEHLSEAEKRAFMIADNRLAEVAVWDDRLLGEALKALAVVDLDFDIEAIGFEMGEIDLRIESLKAAERGTGKPPDPAVAGPSVSRAGDRWRLGPHELLCGAREPRPSRLRGLCVFCAAGRHTRARRRATGSRGLRSTRPRGCALRKPQTPLPLRGRGLGSRGRGAVSRPRKALIRRQSSSKTGVFRRPTAPPPPASGRMVLGRRR